MGTDVIVCSRCSNVVPRATRYCPRCGEPLDTALVEELQSLYKQLRTFDDVIADGAGQRSVADLRAEYLQRYLDLRRGPVAAAPITVPLMPGAETPPPASPAAAAAASTPAAIPSPAPVSTAAPAAGAPAAAVLAGAVSVQDGPVFSWRRFVAEQAIAIMAYLGGFLLLVATLAFVVGAWQALPDPVKFIGVVVVYVVFGVLGFAFRNSERLRTVGRVYLGVFALMTPLVALALYRFELQHIPNFPISAMVCLSAAYAAIIYLALAWRTQFATYAYLGWTSLGVAGLAVISWLAAPSEWTFFVLGAIGLVLLLPHQLRRMSRLRDFVAIAAEPALQLSSLASAVAAIGTLVIGLTIWGAGAAAPRGVGPSLPAFALSACILVPLAVGWSLTLRSLGGGSWGIDPLIYDTVDWLVAAFAAQTVIAVASWAHVAPQGVAVLLGAVALAECACALVLRSAARERANLRQAILVLAFIVGALGAIIVQGDAPPNWPLIIA
ncbi:MAG TPA: zinc ribbon domain-containing protein, partial [Ktedonobacterales bacterium]